MGGTPRGETERIVWGGECQGGCIRGERKPQKKNRKARSTGKKEKCHINSPRKQGGGQDKRPVSYVPHGPLRNQDLFEVSHNI